MIMVPCREGEAEDSAAAESEWAAATASGPRQQPPGFLPVESLPDAPPGTGSQDWDEQARAEWKAFLRKSKMFQVRRNTGICRLQVLQLAACKAENGSPVGVPGLPHEPP